MSDVSRLAHAVLFPIADTFETDGWFGDFLRGGGRSVLMASSAEEYAARRIGDARRSRESAEQVRDFGGMASAVAGCPVVLAADAEAAGVQRFEHLLPAIPRRGEFSSYTDDQLHDAFRAYGAAAKALGVSLFVGPVLDVITGANDWLADRTMADDLDEVGRIGAVFVDAVQGRGVTAMAKHFPGHPDLPANAIYQDVVLHADREVVERNIEPFRRLIAKGVGSVMVGPAVVAALDPLEPAATSTVVIDLLRAMGFSGIVVSDDLDAASTMRGRTLGEVAVASISAGVQLLLIPGGRKHVSECVNALVGAVDTGVLALERLRVAAEAVTTFADQSVGTNVSTTRC